MPTLISMNVAGRCIGRCDARCYDAEHSGCDCICGGMNHGAGETQALHNTRDCWADWAKDYAKRKGITTFTSKVNPEALQISLFETQAFTDVALKQR